MPRLGGPREPKQVRGDARVQAHLEAVDGDAGDWLQLADAAKALGLAERTVKNKGRGRKLRTKASPHGRLYFIPHAETPRTAMSPAQLAIRAILNGTKAEDLAQHFRDFTSADVLELEGFALVEGARKGGRLDQEQFGRLARMIAILDRSVARRRHVQGVPGTFTVEYASAPAVPENAADLSDDIKAEA